MVDRKIIIIFQINITTATTNCKQHGAQTKIATESLNHIGKLQEIIYGHWVDRPDEAEEILDQILHDAEDLEDDCSLIGFWNNIVLCPKQCPWTSEFGNSICDAVNNIESCGYDGGDCCGDFNDYDMCYSVCYSFDQMPNQSYVRQHFESISQCFENCKCKGFYDGTDSFLAYCNPYHYGDGYCDDYLNTPECNYDGGDCCISGHVEQKYCYECECLKNNDGQPLFDPNFLGPTCPGTCEQNNYNEYGGPQYQGDGTCDDGNNNCGCEWDGGDCCGGNINFCEDCECRIDQFSPTTTTNTTLNTTTTATTDHGKIYRGFMRLLNCPDFKGCTYPCIKGSGRCNRFYSPIFVEQEVELVQLDVEEFVTRASAIGDRSSVNYVIGYNINIPGQPLLSQAMVCMKGGWILMLRNVSNFWDFPVMLTRIR